MIIKELQRQKEEINSLKIGKSKKAKKESKEKEKVITQVQEDTIQNDFTLMNPDSPIPPAIYPIIQCSTQPNHIFNPPVITPVMPGVPIIRHTLEIP